MERENGQLRSKVIELEGELELMREMSRSRSLLPKHSSPPIEGSHLGGIIMTKESKVVVLDQRKTNKYRHVKSRLIPPSSFGSLDRGVSSAPHLFGTLEEKLVREPKLFQTALAELRDKAMGLKTEKRTPRTRLQVIPGPHSYGMSKDDLSVKYPFALKKMVREGLRYLRNEFGLRFESVFDCFAYFDASGDWDVKVNDLVVGIRRLKIDLRPIDADETLRMVDKHNDGKVDPRSFVQLLSWHPLLVALKSL